MKQIVDKLNKIAKKINENVELSDRDLIIDSLDSITKAYGGTPNDSTLIVDKLDDIYNNISSAPSGNIEITENTAEGSPLNIAPYATATVNVSGGGDIDLLHTTVNIVNNTDSAYVPNATLLGYAVKLSELNENYKTVLYCTNIDGPYGVELSTLTVSVPRNTTLSFNAYYLNSQTTEYFGGVIDVEANATATNMTYDDGWFITDITQNSSLTYVIDK